MILGSVLELDGISKLDTKRMDQFLEVALDEIRTNPIIDEQLRKNQVIMNELRTAIASVSRGETRSAAEHPRAKDLR